MSLADRVEIAADVVVIGLGAMGASAAEHLASRGRKVVGVERFGPLHDRGSSHGDSRIIRLGYFEGEAYVPLLQRAYRNWRTLEARSREDLLTITGALQIGRPESPVVSGVLASCAANGFAHEILEPAEMARRFPAFALAEDEIAVLEPSGGFLRPERAILASLRIAGEGGAILRFNEKVVAIEPDDGGVTVVSDLGRYRANSVVVATGSHIASLVPALRGIAAPIRQVVGWYEPRDVAATRLGAMPIFLTSDGGEGSFFGFPALGPDGIKVGRHTHFMEPIDPEAPNPPVNEADRALLDDFIAARLPAAGRSLAFATCRYTMLPGEAFLLDLLPSEPRIVVASPCSGHGFKFVSVVGEILADLATNGETPLPIAPFSFAELARRVASG